MKKYLLVLAVFITLSVSAQELASLSKVKLKDGSQFTALIIENQPGSFIKIKITDDQESTINYSEIESIKDKYYTYQTKFLLPKGLYFEGAYSFMFGRSGSNSDLRVGMSLGATANYRFNTFLSLGAGAEINALYTNANYMMVPLFARISGSLAEKRVAPYYTFDAGWSTASTGDMEQQDFEMNGGLMLRPEIGIRINRLKVGVAYQMQQVNTRYTQDLWWGWGGGDQQIIEEERTMKNVKIGMTLEF